MKIGFNIFRMRPEVLIDVARKAEELGYDSISIPDHLVWPPEIIWQNYPYIPNPYSPEIPNYITSDTPLMDPLMVLTHIAAVTSRVRLVTGIYLLPLYNPLVAARSVVTADVLSNGRLTLGIGLGWMEEEFTAAGIDFRTRARRTDEEVLALKALWTQDTPEFHGKFFNFGPIKFGPKPVQRPHPPLVFGGETDGAVRRAARLGDGWTSLGAYTPEKAAGRVRQFKDLRQEFGRENDPFEVTVGAGRPTVDEVKRYEEAGVDRLQVSVWTHGEEIEGLERFAEEVLIKLR